MRNKGNKGNNVRKESKMEIKTEPAVKKMSSNEVESFNKNKDIETLQNMVQALKEEVRVNKADIKALVNKVTRLTKKVSYR